MESCEKVDFPLSKSSPLVCENVQIPVLIEILVIDNPSLCLASSSDGTTTFSCLDHIDDDMGFKGKGKV